MQGSVGNIRNMKFSLVKWTSVAAAAFVIAQEAHAVVVSGQVTSGTGTFVELAPPIANPLGPANSVGNDTFQNPNLYAFDEDQNVQIGPGALLVDLVPGGGSGTIAAGTVVASHYVFFDPAGATTQSGYVDFDADILAVISSTSTLLASDYLANTGVNYLNPTLRGLEPGDSATIDNTLPYRLRVSWTASSPGDYVRVLTKFSPGANVPDVGSTMAMLLSGLTMLAAAARKREGRS